jgi:hypothetical protein
MGERDWYWQPADPALALEPWVPADALTVDGSCGWWTRLEAVDDGDVDLD